jgi:subtilisin-like proprotein convertase family protein
MRKLLLTIVGIIWTAQLALATTCAGAIAIPAAPSFPYTQSLVCGATNDITSFNSNPCGFATYLGGQESVYSWTPSVTYTNATLSYTGVTWTGIFVYEGCPTAGGTCVGAVANSTSAKTLNVATFTAGVTYYFVFDTWPTPNSPCPGSFTLTVAPPANPATPVQIGGIPTCTTGAQLGFLNSTLTCSASATASGFDDAATTATVTDFSCAAGTITSATLAASIGANCPAWYYYSIVVNGVTVATNQCNQTAFDLTPYLPLTSVSVVSENSPTDSQDNITMNLAVNLNYQVPFSLPANVTYYWQASPTGTSQATPHVDPYYVFSNGTYYVRALNTLTGLWSASSSSVTVTNFPLAAAPPAPLATVNPSCAPAGSTLTVAAAPVGVEYYWQGTTANGTSNLVNASTPYAYTASGTYHVAAYETASQCWSVTTPVTVTVDTYIPAAPSASVDNFNICAGTTTLEISATAPGGSASTNGSNATSTPIPDNNTTGISSTINISNIPAGSTITGITVGVNITHTWDSDVDIFLTGSNGTQIELSTDNGGSGDNYTNTIFSSAGVNPITGGASPFTGTFLPEGNLTTLYSLGNGSWTLTVKDDLGGDTGTLLNWDISITYTLPASTISWYDAATAGNGVGTGTPLETVGTSVLSNPATFGTYEFYAGAVSGSCASSARTLVTVNVANTNAVLTPVDATCNGNNNGTFTLGAIECGTEPFIYSLDGGATFGAIPTDLIAGTYSVIIEDDNGLQSSPISVVVGQPAPPANLSLVDANYYSADISWTSTGAETSWDVEYGPTGFTPGTGTIVNVSTTPFTTLTGLTVDTDYQFYVTPVCGANPTAGGPAAFSTGAGFFTYDNACGPGYTDISGTGTLVNIGDDFSGTETFGVTIPFTFNYQGTGVTDVTINNNGTLLFNTLIGYSTFNNEAIGAGTANGLYAFWDDLDASTVYYQTVGTSPNSQFIVQWNQTPAWIGVAGQDITFQIILDEATSEIYYIYDDAIFGGSQSLQNNGGSATIGAAGPLTDVNVSFNSTTYLENNSCVHFFNALCPNAVISTVTPATEEVTLDWNAGLYGETEWTLIYGPAGFDPLTGGTTINVNTSDANIPGLTQLTEYDVYIYSECTIDNLTSGGLLVSFTTLPWCADPITLGGTTAVDSLFATWNFVPAVGATQALSSFNLQYGPFGFDLYAGTNEVATDIDYADTVANAAWLAGGVYQLYVQAVCGTDTSNYSGPFTFVMPLTNDTVCGAEMLQVNGTVYTFNNTGATATVGEAALITGSNPAGYNGTILPMMAWGSPAIEGSNWYTFVAPASGSMWFSGQDENFFASQIAIYEVTDCADFATFSLVAASDQTTPDIASKVAPYFTVCGLTPGATYYVLHDAWSNGFGGAAIFGQYSIKMTEIVLQAGSFADVINTCTGSTVNLFDGIAGYDNGGVWTAEVPAAGTGITDSLWNSTGLAYQMFNFEYRVTEGCAYDSIVAQVDVYEPSNAGEDGTISVCRNEPYDLLSGLNGTADLGGTWYNPSNQPLASSAVVSSNIPGQYNFVYIAGNGVCPDDSALVLVNVDASCNYLNVDEMFFATMTVMPNPSNGVFNVANTGSTEVFNFEVTDMEGRIVLAKDAAINGSTTTEINLTGKVTGMYMIRVYNDNAEKTFRVILQ